jgi:Helix-turn-helix domain
MTDPDARGAMHALHHVVRRQILRCFEEGEGPRGLTEIATQMRQPVNEVGYHMRVLRGCWAVVQIERAAVRGTFEHLYRSTVPGNPLIEELLRITEAEDEGKLPRRRSAKAE